MKNTKCIVLKHSLQLLFVGVRILMGLYAARRIEQNQQTHRPGKLIHLQISYPLLQIQAFKGIIKMLISNFNNIFGFDIRFKLGSLVNQNHNLTDGHHNIELELFLAGESVGIFIASAIEQKYSNIFFDKGPVIEV